MRLLDLLERDMTADANFKRWFGNSVVVDSNGKPQVVYHGTGANIESFRGMVWASVGTELPSDYALMRQDWNQGDANVMPLYMRVEKPFNADYLPKTVTVSEVFNGMLEQSGIDLSNIPSSIAGPFKTNWDTVKQGRIEEESGPHYDRHNFWMNPSDYFGRKGAEAIRNSFQMLGFDGVQMMEGGELTYGAFNPNQVKSIYNRGSYSDDPNVSEKQQ